MDATTRRELDAKIKLLAYWGPQLECPHVDTLDGSKHANMKELRFETLDSVWRVAFAFDPKRWAVLLVAGNKIGLCNKQEDRFYRQLIRTADHRFDDYT